MEHAGVTGSSRTGVRFLGVGGRPVRRVAGPPRRGTRSNHRVEIRIVGGPLMLDQAQLRALSREHGAPPIDQRPRSLGLVMQPRCPMAPDNLPDSSPFLTPWSHVARVA